MDGNQVISIDIYALLSLIAIAFGFGFMMGKRMVGRSYRILLLLLFGVGIYIFFQQYTGR